MITLVLTSTIGKHVSETPGSREIRVRWIVQKSPGPVRYGDPCHHCHMKRIEETSPVEKFSESVVQHTDLEPRMYFVGTNAKRD